jgi:hypothetical protein
MCCLIVTGAMCCPIVTGAMCCLIVTCAMCCLIVSGLISSYYMTELLDFESVCLCVSG